MTAGFALVVILSPLLGPRMNVDLKGPQINRLYEQ